MSCQLKTRTLFKYLVVVYIATILVIMSKLHLEQPLGNPDALLQQIKELHEKDIRSLRHNVTSELSQTETRIVYVNRTYVKYRDVILPRYGPGENGTKVYMENFTLPEELRNKTAALRKKHGFNTLLSDLVSLHRRVPDLRPQACKDIKYPANLPPISVVIIFRDEWASILLRTAYSVLEHSPPELIKEIVLVDDGSKNEELRVEVDVHVSAVEKLKLVRNKESLGLMLARQRGIEAATAEYFAVMDGHMEVSPGWLEPLLYRLQQQPNALLCSHVGQIFQDTFGIYVDKDKLEEQQYDEQFPFFDPLTLDQQWAWYKQSFRKERNHSMEALEYGTIQGMMAVMRKEFFMRLGGFDPGMKIWGAEQIELSVKVWMCGGRVEMIPCSKVTHMYRVTPWGGLKMKSDYYAANKHRMIDVWLDEPYKSLIMDYIAPYSYQYGDLTDRHRIRKDNKCKPFAAFIAKVMELSDVFIPVDVRVKGAIYSAMADKCLDLSYSNETDSNKLGLYACHGRANQYFLLTQQSQIRSHGHLLISVSSSNTSSAEIEVIKAPVNLFDTNTYWRYGPDSTIVHEATKECLTITPLSGLRLSPCLGHNNQIWTWALLEQTHNKEE